MPEPTPEVIGLMEQTFQLQLRSESGTVVQLGEMTLELHVQMNPDGTLSFRDVWGPVADALEAAALQVRAAEHGGRA